VDAVGTIVVSVQVCYPICLRLGCTALLLRRALKRVVFLHRWFLLHTWDRMQCEMAGYEQLIASVEQIMKGWIELIHFN
jgi:hypothetical protein